MTFALARIVSFAASQPSSLSPCETYSKVVPGLSSSPFNVKATPAEIIRAAHYLPPRAILDRAGNSHPGLDLDITGFNYLDIALFGAVNHGMGQRMLRAPFKRRSNSQQRSFIHIWRTTNRNDGRLPMRQRSGFIECDGIRSGKALNGLAAFEEDAQLCAASTATVSAAGTARPIAHGQAITRTAIEIAKALLKPPVGSKTAHAIKVRAASASTTGTKMELTRSAISCIGAFED